MTVGGFTATSIDGCIARMDGGIDRLIAANARLPKGADCGCSAFMAAGDMPVMGGHTCKTARAFIMR
jgi:hypothetical protein